MLAGSNIALCGVAPIATMVPSGRVISGPTSCELLSGFVGTTSSSSTGTSGSGVHMSLDGV